jgi:hypothetical protein
MGEMNILVLNDAILIANEIIFIDMNIEKLLITIYMRENKELVLQDKDEESLLVSFNKIRNFLRDKC